MKKKFTRTAAFRASAGAPLIGTQPGSDSKEPRFTFERRDCNRTRQTPHGNTSPAPQLRDSTRPYRHNSPLVHADTRVRTTHPHAPFHPRPMKNHFAFTRCHKRSAGATFRGTPSETPTSCTRAIGRCVQHEAGSRRDLNRSIASARNERRHATLSSSPGAAVRNVCPSAYKI